MKKRILKLIMGLTIAVIGLVGLASCNSNSSVTTPTVINGVDGKSAYEVAVANGFSGTEEEWIASLHASNQDAIDAISARVSALETTINSLSTKEEVTAVSKELAEIKAAINAYGLTDLKVKVSNLETTLGTVSTSLEAIQSDVNDCKTAYYVVNIYDIDDELLASKKIKGTGSDDFFTNLTMDFNVDYTESQYGPYINSIEGQVQDPNWYISIYENGEYSQVGVSQLHIDNGDVFDFKVECWNTVASGYGTFDEYDILVDKAIYHYGKTYLKNFQEKATTYKSARYWDDLIVYAMSSNGYDTSVFNVDAYAEAYKDSVKNEDVATLSGANLGKWFYAARLFDLDMDDFKTVYQNYLESLTAYGSEYVMPFTLSPAVYLEMTNFIADDVKNTTKRAGTNWGVDGLTWQITNLSLLQELDPVVELAPFTASTKGNGISTALCLLPYAALNSNVRDVVNEDGKDLLELLFDTYYDAELNLVKWKDTDKDITGNSNQIYASLVAYKLNRDLGKAVSILA